MRVLLIFNDYFKLQKPSLNFFQNVLSLCLIIKQMIIVIKIDASIIFTLSLNYILMIFYNNLQKNIFKKLLKVTKPC